MKKITKKILPIVLALGIGATSVNAGGINLTPEGKSFRNFLFKEAIKGQINPNSRETNVNVYQQPNTYQQPQQSNCGGDLVKLQWVYKTSDGDLLPVPGCRWVDDKAVNDYRVHCPPGVNVK